MKFNSFSRKGNVFKKEFENSAEVKKNEEKKVVYRQELLDQIEKDKARKDEEVKKNEQIEKEIELKIRSHFAKNKEAMNKTLDILDAYKKGSFPVINTNISHNYVKNTKREKAVLEEIPEEEEWNVKENVEP